MAANPRLNAWLSPIFIPAACFRVRNSAVQAVIFDRGPGAATCGLIFVTAIFLNNDFSTAPSANLY